MMPRKIALVTGGAKRIGAAIVHRLADAGYAVVIHCNHSLDAAQTLARTLTAQGHRAAILQGDLADLDALPQLMMQASQSFGAPTLLINNASLFAQDDVTTLQADLFTANLAINLQAPVLLAKAFAEALPAHENGAIINIIDQRVLRPTPQFLSYAIAKSGLYAATQMLAQALAPRIRVNGVGPGPTLPNIHEGLEGFTEEAAQTLLGHAISPDEIADAVLFLAQAHSITGQMLAVDSGQHLNWK